MDTINFTEHMPRDPS